MSQSVIRVENLWKEYVLGGRKKHQATLRESMGELLSAPWQRLRRLQGKVSAEERFWSLQDLNFDIKAGEVTGIIGRNGAGKSTLLKVLSRITAPTRGRITIKGRVASLLEVGTGFHPELTGRENIFLNGAILGMSRRDIQRQMDAIVGFAEIEKFLDTPVKRYSSGMYIRLAFAVAAHLEPDILLVDEVLAVGDGEFQKRCLGKMNEVTAEGRTVLFVSHNLSALARLCSRGIVLDQGSTVMDGDIHQALAAYSRQINTSGQLNCESYRGPLSDVIRFHCIEINGKRQIDEMQFQPEETIKIRVLGEASRPLDDYRTAVVILKDGLQVLVLGDSQQSAHLSAGFFESTVEIPCYFLSPGTYSIDIAARSLSNGQWLNGRNQVVFTVLEKGGPGYDTRFAMGLVNLTGIGQRRRLQSAEEFNREPSAKDRFQHASISS